MRLREGTPSSWRRGWNGRCRRRVPGDATRRRIVLAPCWRGAIFWLNFLVGAGLVPPLLFVDVPPFLANSSSPSPPPLLPPRHLENLLDIPLVLRAYLCENSRLKIKIAPPNESTLDALSAAPKIARLNTVQQPNEEGNRWTTLPLRTEGSAVLECRLLHHGRGGRSQVRGVRVGEVLERDWCRMWAVRVARFDR